MWPADEWVCRQKCTEPMGVIMWALGGHVWSKSSCSQSSAGTAELLMGPGGLGGQHSAGDASHHHCAGAAPSHSHQTHTSAEAANSPQKHWNSIPGDLQGQSLKPWLKALFHHCLWQLLGQTEIGFCGVGKHCLPAFHSPQGMVTPAHTRQRHHPLVSSEGHQLKPRVTNRVYDQDRKEILCPDSKLPHQDIMRGTRLQFQINTSAGNKELILFIPIMNCFTYTLLLCIPLWDFTS